MFERGAPLAALAGRATLSFDAVDRIGDDLRIVARFASTGAALMFTGIVQAVGRIVAVEPRGDGLRIGVDAAALDIVRHRDRRQRRGRRLLPHRGRDATARGSRSTCRPRRCAARRASMRAAPVNLEKALRFGDRLGGHLVAGHVDGVGTVRAMRRWREAGGSVTLEVDAPAPLARFIAPKGSIAVHGVSLTVNGVDGARFAVNLIPHTLAVTTLGAARARRARQPRSRPHRALRRAARRRTRLVTSGT